MSKSSAANIKHVVVVMFENRSFDHILGAMPGVNGVLDASGNIKPELYNYLDPTNPNQPGNFKQAPFPIAPGASEAAYVSDSGGADFDHDFDKMFIDLDGPGTTGVVNGLPRNKPWPVYPATNCGFVSVNDDQSGRDAYPLQYPIMSYFQWGSMQVLHRLAQEYVVCDNWFCDMPGHTAPNRAFMHCATTGGLGIEEGDNANEQWPIKHWTYMVEKESIFERLEKYGNTWKMYVPSPGGDTNYTYGHLDTYFLNANVAGRLYDVHTPDQTNCSGVPLERFVTDVQAGKLPTYSFIMCFDQFAPAKAETSMHPVGPIEAGENMLAGIYNALRNSPHWQDTLLIVNFDENGGIYDHVRPPRTVPPHPDKPAHSIPVGGKEIVFDFSILGFRIPAILISPWLKRGIESQQLQNTSVLRFLQDQFCPPTPPFDPLQPPVSHLTQRDRFANSLQIAFDDFGLTTPRMDCLDTIATYSGWPYATGLNEPRLSSEEIQQLPQLKYLATIASEYLSPLPGHPDSGRSIPRHFDKAVELSDYARERLEAATAYFNQGTAT